MAITTYSSLKDGIAGSAGESYSHRNDVLSNFDNFLALTEEYIWENLRIRDMETRSQATVSTSSRFLALPDNFLEARKVVLISGNNHYPLVYRTPESMQVQPSAGRPKFFTRSSQIEFDRIPDSAYTAENQHYAKLTGLSTSNSTNAIITNYPSIYIYGCAYNMHVWAQNDVKAAQFFGLFDQSIRNANKKDKKGRYGSAPAALKEGSTP